jgi:hypothetical protein
LTDFDQGLAKYEKWWYSSMAVIAIPKLANLLIALREWDQSPFTWPPSLSVAPSEPKPLERRRDFGALEK